MYFSLQIAKLGYFPKIPNPAQKEQDSGYIVCATATRLSSEGKQTKITKNNCRKKSKNGMIMSSAFLLIPSNFNDFVFWILIQTVTEFHSVLNRGYQRYRFHTSMGTIGSY